MQAAQAGMAQMRLFRDRRDAGNQLARRLGYLAGRPGILVLGLPRGGVPVAREVANAVGAPLDVFVVRKLGVPGNPEFALGALASGGVRVLNDEVIDALGIPGSAIAQVTDRERQELQRRERVFRGDRPFPDVRGSAVVLVDDGIATGATMLAAVRAMRQLGAQPLIVAAPVIAAQTREQLRRVADAVECVAAPEEFLAVGAWYDDFHDVSDDEVQSALATPRRRAGHAATVEGAVTIAVGEVELQGTVAVPADAAGLVIFAHGSGSSRHSPRNRAVAAELHRAGFATLLFDLLTAREEAADRVSAGWRFDIPLLSARLDAVTSWAAAQPDLGALPVAYFGASTGAAAALRAAAHRIDVRCVVSRGGRPDLAGDALARVTAPTLLIVGERDREVIALNAEARRRMPRGVARIEIVAGATHLFEEPGALDAVSRLAAAFLAEHLDHAAARHADAPAGGSP